MSHATGGATADAKRAAISAKQVAMIGGIAGILSALIAIPTTIISADRASETAFKTVELQLNGETDKSRAEFLRGQRQTLYSTIAGHEQALVEQETEYERKIGELSKAQLRANLTKGPSTYDARQKLVKDGFSVEIVGSKPVRDVFHKLTAKHEVHEQLLYDLTVTAAEGYSDTKGATESVLMSAHEITVLEDRFKEAARIDMGAG